MKNIDLLYYNDIGGFTKDYKEYVIKTKEKYTPVPWSHILANEKFGTVITSSGGGYTWSGNSRENKITAWSNLQIEDIPSEEIFINSEASSIRAVPRDNLDEYEIHYGFGYAEFIREDADLCIKNLVYVPIDRSEKNSVIEIKNLEDKDKNYEIVFLVNPVLGVMKEFTKKHFVFEKTSNGICAQNKYRENYKDEKVYFEILGEDAKVESEITSDKKIKLRTQIRVCAKSSIKIICKISLEKTFVEFSKALENYKNDILKLQDFWEEKLEKITIKTPVESFNIMMNGWLAYQTLTCRMWARTSFYQAGGAFGFRDQLQDSLMYLNIEPEITRKQILYHAEHQFVEGDVLHWWHPEKTNGIRTRFSDDLLWLPYAICEYIETTEDYTILDEVCGYVQASLLRDDQDEIYMEVSKSSAQESLYLHAIKAIEKSLNFGKNGIPKMGSGDWNDGMSNVKGESVWLGFFLYNILIRFAKICEYKKDVSRKGKYLMQAEELKKALNENAWDGKWYKRAFFEDGTAIGSETSSECKIDGISQSFAVISGAGDLEKCKEAMKNVDKNLVDRENMLIKLLTPAFLNLEKNPGYIKAYIAGVRENGGQYTHGAIWSIIANIMLGKGEKAVEYFRIINPIEHARTFDASLKYKVEPYVVSADVYSNTNMLGRGGWSWYTGSSSWLYIAGLQYILGLKRKGNTLVIEPCFSKEWESVFVEYKYCDAIYEINIYNPDKKEKGFQKMYLDNELKEKNQVELKKEGRYKVDFII